MSATDQTHQEQTGGAARGQIRSGLDLVASSAISAGLGFLFWILAARSFDEATVGLNATLISTMMLVAGLASLGLPNALVRFVPAFGVRAGRLVGQAYLVAVALTAVMAVGIGLVVGRRFDQLVLLRSAGGIAAFAGACVIWQIFVLQDSVLTAISATRVVPIENTAFALAKLALLVPLAWMGAQWGVFTAWVAPLVIAVLVINTLIVLRLRRSRRTGPADPSLDVADVIRFALGEHGGTLLSIGLIGLLPLLVLDRLGGASSAHYATSWAVAYNLFLASVNIGTAMLAQAAHQPHLLAQQQRVAVKQMALLVIPGAAGLILLAPYLLAAFGSAYAAEATGLVRLLALASVAHIPVAVATSAARAERRIGQVLAIVAAEVVLVGGLSILTVDQLGLAGVGAAWFTAEVVLAAYLIIRQWRGRSRGARTALEAGHLAVTWSAVALALVGLSRVDDRSIPAAGLLPVVPALTIVAALVLVVSAVVAIYRRPMNELRAALHVLGVVVLLTGAPSVVYETPRYAWTYKHLGIVDYITRNGGVDRSIDRLDVYHNFPGFFAAVATLTDLTGVQDSLGIATWAPLAFDVAMLLCLAFVLRQLVASRRTVWLAVLLFFLVNWIGQDYFAPQALALVLYLLVVGMILLYHRRHGSNSPTLISWAVLTAGMIALVSSHQVTSIILLTSLVGLAVIREIPARIPLLMVASLTGWLLLGAWPFLTSNLATYFGTIGAPTKNAAVSFGLAPDRNAGQELVALAGRGLFLAVGVVAVIGAILMLLDADRELTPFVLAGAPVSLLFMQFGGEALFRVILFALPVVCLFAAHALGRITRAGISAAVAAGLAAGALVPFSLAYYGKDSFYTFQRDEVALVRTLSTSAPFDSLLVVATDNYPGGFSFYEKFVQVPLAAEPTQTIQEVDADPADVLYGWMSDDRWAASYVLLSRSQRAEVDAVGSLPRDLPASIDQALRSDPRFSIAFENGSGVVFTLAGAHD